MTVNLREGIKWKLSVDLVQCIDINNKQSNALMAIFQVSSQSSATRTNPRWLSFGSIIIDSKLAGFIDTAYDVSHRMELLESMLN